MFKSLLVIFFVILVLWAGRGLMLRMQNKPAIKPAKNKDMVQCQQCKTYIPGDDAITLGDKNFCSTQHLEDWKHSA